MTNPLSDPAFVAGLRPIPSGADGSPPSWPAVDLVGTRLDGTPVSFDIGAAVAPVLLVFLSTNCDGCDVFWKGLAEPPAGLEVVVVTKGPDPATAAEVAALSSGLSGVPVVMSDAAWTDYRVTGYPFLVLVEPGTRTVLGESVGFRWSDLEALRSKLPGG